MFFRRIKCLICDLGLAYLLYYGFGYINPWRIPLTASYFCFVGLYFLIAFFIFKRSIFQYLFGIETGAKPLAYVIFKILFLSIIPFLLTFRTGVFGLSFVFFFLLIFNTIPCLVKKKTIWEWCATTKLTASQQGIYTHTIAKVAFAVVSALLITTFIQQILLLQKENKDVIIDYAIPATRTAISVSQIKKQRYINDIKKYKQEPFEYLMRLFENKDIIVLCERAHPEYTQWKFFSQMILNDTFASKVGNIATEFGRINEQARLDSLLGHSFDSEEDRRKTFAALIRENGGMWPLWSNTNIYDFAINLSRFNEKLEENQEINWFFCDVAGDWGEINDWQEWANNNFENYDRDSIMAANIINIFDNLDNAKLLVIENTRHAYKTNRENGMTTADYLYRQYGEKAAFVWINNISCQSPIEVLKNPYQMGLLDAAAAHIKDSIWALSFSHSILGEDRFELLPFGDKWHLKMKELFDGMIYCLPPSQQFEKIGYRYILSDFVDTLLRRNKIVFGEERGELLTDNEINNHREPRTQTVRYFTLFNLVFYLFHYFVLLYLLLCLISILRKNNPTVTRLFHQ